MATESNEFLKKIKYEGPFFPDPLDILNADHVEIIKTILNNQNQIKRLYILSNQGQRQPPNEKFGRLIMHLHNCRRNVDNSTKLREYKRIKETESKMNDMHPVTIQKTNMTHELSDITQPKHHKTIVDTLRQKVEAMKEAKRNLLHAIEGKNGNVEMAIRAVANAIQFDSIENRIAMFEGINQEAANQGEMSDELKLALREKVIADIHLILQQDGIDKRTEYLHEAKREYELYLQSTKSQNDTTPTDFTEHMRLVMTQVASEAFRDFIEKLNEEKVKIFSEFEDMYTKYEDRIEHNEREIHAIEEKIDLPIDSTHEETEEDISSEIPIQQIAREFSQSRWHASL